MARKKRTLNYLIIGLVAVLLFVAGIFYLFSEKLLLNPDEEMEKSILDEIDRDKINIAQEKIIINDFPDYDPLFSLVDEKQDNIESIFAVCEEFNPIVCLKYASKQNPDLREEICDRLVEEINKKYAGKKINVEGHKQECLWGIFRYVG